jgi:predicted metal-binding membrane protein
VTSPVTAVRQITLTSGLIVGAVCLPLWIYLASTGHGVSGHGMSSAAAGSMHGEATADGPATRGGIGVAVWAVMWSAMVVAMMLPVAVPLIAAHRFLTRVHGRRGSLATVAFVSGYIGVWTAVGVVPLTISSLAHSALSPSHEALVLQSVAGPMIVLAGAFQFSGLKSRCMSVCRTPMQFMLAHPTGGSIMAEMRAGMRQGVYCIGCCWLLMLTQTIIGISSVVFMAVTTVVMMIERSPRIGVHVTPLLGTGLILAGVLVSADAVLRLI